MRPTRNVPLLVIAAGVAIALSGRTSAQSSDPFGAAQRRQIDFAPDVQPLLRANCYGCHSASLRYGKDQFISAAATNWATMALTWTVR